MFPQAPLGFESRQLVGNQEQALLRREAFEEAPAHERVRDEMARRRIGQQAGLIREASESFDEGLGIGAELTELTKAQAEYIGVDVAGPYKPEHYRY